MYNTTGLVLVSYGAVHRQGVLKSTGAVHGSRAGGGLTRDVVSLAEFRIQLKMQSSVDRIYMKTCLISIHSNFKYTEMYG